MDKNLFYQLRKKQNLYKAWKKVYESGVNSASEKTQMQLEIIIEIIKKLRQYRQNLGIMNLNLVQL
jgi:hypothetical protein